MAMVIRRSIAFDLRGKAQGVSRLKVTRLRKIVEVSPISAAVSPVNTQIRLNQLRINHNRSLPATAVAHDIDVFTCRFVLYIATSV